MEHVIAVCAQVRFESLSEIVSELVGSLGFSLVVLDEENVDVVRVDRGGFWLEACLIPVNAVVGWVQEG